MRYAPFHRRVRALAIDTAIIAAGIVATALLGDSLRGVPGMGRIMWIVYFGLIFLYEPLMVWRRGATIGHSASDLIIVGPDPLRRLSLGRSFSRYLIKLVLGLASFFTIALTRRHQAVHDLLTRTTVQVPGASGDATSDYHLEREEPQGALPSWSRRGVAIVGHLVLLFVIFTFAVGTLAPAACFEHASRCSPEAKLALDVASIAWLGLSLGIVILGWRGLLPGAKRHPEP